MYYPDAALSCIIHLRTYTATEDLERKATYWIHERNNIQTRKVPISQPPSLNHYASITPKKEDALPSLLYLGHSSLLSCTQSQFHIFILLHMAIAERVGLMSRTPWAVYQEMHMETRWHFVLFCVCLSMSMQEKLCVWILQKHRKEFNLDFYTQQPDKIT